MIAGSSCKMVSWLMILQLGCVLASGPSHIPADTSNVEESAEGNNSLTHFINPINENYSDQHFILESDRGAGSSAIPSYQAFENGPGQEEKQAFIIDIDQAETSAQRPGESPGSSSLRTVENTFASHYLAPFRLDIEDPYHSDIGEASEKQSNRLASMPLLPVSPGTASRKFPVDRFSMGDNIQKSLEKSQSMSRGGFTDQSDSFQKGAASPFSTEISEAHPPITSNLPGIKTSNSSLRYFNNTDNLDKRKKSILDVFALLSFLIVWAVIAQMVRGSKP
ncbi:hypothetical protein PGT21_010755 [Puccinia graminis f. sp. tritici]|uniref:Uncharacterized protein n=1 Tax=Puccinia graminis f. sp. tritici TaxID=56615 RepID=A0A5B0MCY8_PUCGR|nr:hypothetical protein PGTUg99_016653 [Puccinia graminis f. sp. tritici]KAA1090688.1 hypothetical protein PGT21_010755 [Puccinia graminis f. sp. tritici]